MRCFDKINLFIVESWCTTMKSAEVEKREKNIFSVTVSKRLSSWFISIAYVKNISGKLFIGDAG